MSYLYQCEACADPAEFIGFGHPDRRTCKRHKDMYVRLAGPSAQVACWLPIAPAPRAEFHPRCICHDRDPVPPGELRCCEPCLKEMREALHENDIAELSLASILPVDKGTARD